MPYAGGAFSPTSSTRESTCKNKGLLGPQKLPSQEELRKLSTSCHPATWLTPSLYFGLGTYIYTAKYETTVPQLPKTNKLQHQLFGVVNLLINPADWRLGSFYNNICPFTYPSLCLCVPLFSPPLSPNAHVCVCLHAHVCTTLCIMHISVVYMYAAYLYANVYILSPTTFPVY